MYFILHWVSFIGSWGDKSLQAEFTLIPAPIGTQRCPAWPTNRTTADTSQRSDRAVISPDLTWTCCTVTTSSFQTFTTVTQLLPPEFCRLPCHITQGNNVVFTHRFLSTWPVRYVEHIL